MSSNSASAEVYDDNASDFGASTNEYVTRTNIHVEDIVFVYQGLGIDGCFHDDLTNWLGEIC
jgi:hypothetical protein